MEKYYAYFAISIIILGIYSWYNRNDWKNFSEMNSYDKLNVIRVPFIMMAIVVSLIIVILKNLN